MPRKQTPEPEVEPQLRVDPDEARRQIDDRIAKGSREIGYFP